MFEISKRHQRQRLGRVGRERCEPKIQKSNHFRNDYYVSLSSNFHIDFSFLNLGENRGKFFSKLSKLWSPPEHTRSIFMKFYIYLVLFLINNASSEKVHTWFTAGCCIINSFRDITTDLTSSFSILTHFFITFLGLFPSSIRETHELVLRTLAKQS